MPPAPDHSHSAQRALLARLRALTGLLASSELPARAAAFYSRLPGLAPPHPEPPAPALIPAPPSHPRLGAAVLPLTEVGGLRGRTRAGSGGRWGSRRPKTESGRRDVPRPPGEGAGAQDERGRSRRSVAVKARLAPSVPSQGTGRRERKKGLLLPQSRHHSTFLLLNSKPFPLFVSGRSNRIQSRPGLEVPWRGRCTLLQSEILV